MVQLYGIPGAPPVWLPATLVLPSLLYPETPFAHVILFPSLTGL